ncbi:MAG: ATP-binding protein [Chloroflexi bacterium]|nr:ATP-binding protein [Chloroflexota bacterium]
MKRRLRIGDVGKSQTIRGQFVGREKELALFEDSLGKTCRLTENSSEDEWLYPHVFLVVGLGGMSKSTLVDEFLKLTEKKRPKTLGLKIDGENPAIVDDDSFMRIVVDHLLKLEPHNTERAFKPYLDAILTRKEARRKVDEEQRQEREGEYESVVNAFAKVVSLPAGPIAPVAEEAVKATVHRGARFLAGTFDEVVNRLHKRGGLDLDEYELLKDNRALTERFVEGLEELSKNT